MELVIQKAVELGASEVVPVSSGRCVVKLDARKAETRVNRWNAIAAGAAKQSKRMIVPEVQTVMSFSQALEYAGNMDVKLIPYEKAEGIAATPEISVRHRTGTVGGRVDRSGGRF